MICTSKSRLIISIHVKVWFLAENVLNKLLYIRYSAYATKQLNWLYFHIANKAVEILLYLFKIIVNSSTIIIYLLSIKSYFKWLALYKRVHNNLSTLIGW